ncbi:MAPEG family protein [Novosphingobium sp. TH158]|uniref:MAPEG family protein n=1 Tax=Novosphingobium sp. TH158 TaxID=2067455 RepID=UPI000C7E6659|nr:MAPEG family protein [Novosphingobium sp. TH158]PLK25614.1 GST-like protein [Novosphingobium sp. TH158]
MNVLLPTTLCLAAAALVVNFWLGMRIGKLRHAHNVSVGDGGNEMIMRRMRAQLNFVEQTPLILIGIGLVELAGKGGAWLAPAGAVFMIGRICHAIGMDGPFKAGRPIGVITAMLMSIVLVVVAVMASLGKM